MFAVILFSHNTNFCVILYCDLYNSIQHRDLKCIGVKWDQAKSNSPLPCFYSRSEPRFSWLSRLHDHTQRHTTISRTPLGGLSARRRDLYLTTHNTHKRQISMPSTGLEPATPANDRPRIHAIDHMATGIKTKNMDIKVFKTEDRHGWWNCAFYLTNFHDH